MKTFRNYMKDLGIDVPHDNIPGDWFSKTGIPMIVACTCCGMTMAAPSALIDNNGQCYCSGCAGED